MDSSQGPMRELPVYSEYVRFGPTFRTAPESVSLAPALYYSNGRRRGCWCSYAWIFLLIVLVILSLVISNLCIYFLMKDNCDANIAKVERELHFGEKASTENQDSTEDQDPKKSTTKRPKLIQFFTSISQPTTKIILPNLNDNTIPEQTTSAVVATGIKVIQNPASDERTTSQTTRKLNLNTWMTNGDNVAAGIIQLEATIRIPQQEQNEDEIVVSPNSALEELFDLARYFSIKQQQSDYLTSSHVTPIQVVQDTANVLAAVIPISSAFISETKDEDNIQFPGTVVPIDNFPLPIDFRSLRDKNNQRNTGLPAQDQKQIESFKITSASSILSKTVSPKPPVLLTSLHEEAVTNSKSSTLDLSTAQLAAADKFTINPNNIEPSIGYENSELFNEFEDVVASDNHKVFPTNIPNGIKFTTAPPTTQKIQTFQNQLIPTSYLIEWQPHLNESPDQFTFDGFVLIDFSCLRATNQIVLNSRDLSVDQRSTAIIEKNNGDNSFVIEDMQIDAKNALIIFTLDKSLRQGFNYSFGTRFFGQMSYNGPGLSYLDYLDGDSKRYLAATQFEVAEARRAFPCFDEPRFKANFTITVVRKSNMISLSNMQLVQSIQKNNQWVEDHYATSVKMSTYLVAFVVCDFHFKQAMSKRGVAVRAFARQDLINETDHALKTAVKLLDYFEEYFDIPYALPKLDLIALPDFSHGAMENWGLVTFKESTMLYNGITGLTQQRETVSMIVGHELAHQWFGDLVTMRWWNDLWLNEGFAHYMGYVSAEIIYPDEPMEHVYILSNALEALRLDAMSSTHPVLFEVLHPLEIVQLFDTITYKKGSCLVRMMAHFLGAETLRKGLQIYLKSNAYKNTVSNDLWSALDQAVDFFPNDKSKMAGLSVTTVMDNWIRVTGHPVVTVFRDYDAGTAVLTQKRMQQHVLTSTEEKDEQTWVVPFTYSTSDNLNWNEPKFVWVQNQTTHIYNLPSSSHWFVGNVNFNGFYRVNYDETNWRLLFEQMNVNHLAFTDAQRAQILADSFDFSSTGHLDISMALTATEYLKKETEFLPWLVALKTFHYFDIILQTTEHYELYKKFMRIQLNPLYDKLGWKQRPTDNKHILYLRYAIIDQSCHYENEDCLQNTNSMFQSWMRGGDTNTISIELKPIVKCYGVSQGGNDEMKHVIKALKDVKSAICTKHENLLETILAFGLNDTFARIWHLPELVRAASTTLMGRRVARKFIVDNWNVLAKTLNEVAGEFSYVFQQSSDKDDLIQLQHFISSDVRVAWRKFDEAKEALEMNLKWKEKYLNKVVSWLNSKVGHLTS